MHKFILALSCILMMLAAPISVQDFQKLGCFGTHPGVDVGFGAFDVVMHVIAEQVNQINGVVNMLVDRSFRDRKTIGVRVERYWRTTK